MIDKETLDKIYELLNTNKFEFDGDAVIDIYKHGHNCSKEFILDCLKKGKIYKGSEIYPDIKSRHNRYYCIHKYSTLSFRLMLIGFLVLKNILIIHICTINK